MIYALTMFLPTIFKNKKITALLTVLAIALIIGTSINNLMFIPLNLIAFGLTLLICRKSKSAVTGILSILIWSVIIDTICYFVYPAFVMGRSLPQYVFDGILFNYKWCLMNAGIYAVVKSVEYIIKKDIVLPIIYVRKLNNC